MLWLWPLALLLAVPRTAQPKEVLVSAAVSLSEALQQIGRLYEARTGERVILNLAASNTLARQIDAGAKVDLFISADEAQMNVVAGDIVASTREDLLSN